MYASFSHLHLKTSTVVPSKVPGEVLIRTSPGASKTSSSTILDLCPHRTADVGWEGSRNRTEVPVWFTMFKLPWLRHLWWMSKVTRIYINWEPKIFSLKLVTFRSWNVCFLKVSKDDVASSLCIFAKRPVYWGNISCQKSLSHPVARYSRPWPPCTCPVQGGWTGECLMRS